MFIRRTIRLQQVRASLRKRPTSRYSPAPEGETDMVPLALERALEAKAYIAADNPIAAEKWASGLVDAAKRLKRFPNLGRVVPEIGREDYRELVYGNYRIVYRTSENV